MKLAQLLLLLFFMSSPAGGLTHAERIAARARVEKILHDHRLWPKDNKTPKPPFNEILPDSLILAKVDGLLKKSAALEKFWDVRYSNAELDREVARMKTHSRDPAMLEEIFSALNHDPVLIRETLARDSLTENLIHRLYARDPRYHVEAKARADRIMSGDIAAWRDTPGRRSLEVLRRGDAPALVRNLYPETVSETVLPPEEFAKLANVARPDALLPAIETDDGFQMRKVIKAGNATIETETLTLPKLAFDGWWASVAPALPATISGANGLEVFSVSESAVAATIAAACDQWTNPAGFAANPPSARYGHTAVWTGAEMIVWGGTAGNSGGRYLPSLDTWYPTSQGTNVPQQRGWFTAVWTGNEMIIWGGSYYIGTWIYLNNGGRYNPAGDSWLPTPGGAGLPESRDRHTAVWTGSEMIVWGGEVCYGFRCNPYYLNSGGRLNPASGAWFATSIAGAPQARVVHSAIWSGDQMIIWGGYSTSNLNDGAQYKPEQNIWTPVVISTNTPSARIFHTSVWTGQEMIVWGGENGSTTTIPLNDGARYNPVTGQWWPLSNTSAPEARFNHTAVWTGSEMVIWGGGLNSGGRYQPGNDGWRATTTNLSVPVARGSNTAIWNGSEMIVWGGRDSTSAPLNNGGMYKSGAAPSPGNTLYATKSSLINFNWSTVYGAGSYNVKRADLATALFPYTPTTIVSTPTIPQYSEPDDGQSHFYAVEAVNQCGATP